MVKEINLLSLKIIDQNYSSSQIVDLILKNRKIKNVNEFLKPGLPQIKLNLKPALNLINKAIKNNEKIIIYGDYDVDGITATAILWQAIHKIYPNVTPFIPHREIDGYGIKATSFFRFQEEKNIKFDLLITVDNGIVADKELKKIKDKQDIKIIVTDHHIVPDSTSRDKACLVPTDCIIHNTKICGSAISYFLAKEIDNKADLGLAALGTVADCLPLVGVNRSIVIYGLQQLNKNPSPGIKKLIQISGIKNALSTYDLGFILGPRINAVGRLSDPTDALRLLCSQNENQATKYAQVLNNFNQDRQLIQKESFNRVENLISDKLKSDKLVFVSGDYNPGIIGLISGRLTEKYYLPSIVISVDGDIAKGSCRSIPKLNIISALREYSDLFIDLGGHSGAAGFSIKTSNISKLKKTIIKSVNLKLNKIHLTPHLDVDAQMQLNAINIKNIKSLESLAPFGIGNPQPLFFLKNITINSIRAIGQNNDHLKIKINNIDAIAFKKGDLVNKIKSGDTIDIVTSLSLNEWNNTTTPQLIVKEIITV
ncbi:single-stranded-DNA-specific exonuclease RecJ [Candidatus Shapirobacteria bacterium CG_4_8_14_3_um_filter_35_11]|uniref:Single-stranded-DNA-specific exonuclease RecJ n=5 Tax=Candidatus Shapironibacteriota TaxID=1752721 RepID=A0A1J5HXI9_9BACT|nr:MAG: single-stranded-DNA-specific exonuclease RecJ [Candidatus Shapirobacteria bacterium CG2_30_35_20]PIV07789.1 MAG: single-stranded-DNA-specific exonuclease RecJ [Candidatus Shapirobacteria bacterium CG03_land_8_20_14_0_80_35_14]PJA51092.1 MAG: single-stranded-DNA-specific exonuclease RecJ [Candidatus Shapirobacteria bacterium CG_4_9_14_3_um_filter_36_12]PJC80934.1 MAG: single-stranded-DNA-specific exonuclease RecJ [Candidatus Shapirobacteria bacterium CG_4_8_14_3_um_filter_35_11]